MNRLIEHLRDIGVIRYGSFMLRSGESSDTYIDLRRIISFPNVFGLVSEMLAEAASKLEVNVVAGAESAGR